MGMGSSRSGWGGGVRAKNAVVAMGFCEPETRGLAWHHLKQPPLKPSSFLKAARHHGATEEGTVLRG
jgi:hypothetical protein